MSYAKHAFHSAFVRSAALAATLLVAGSAGAQTKAPQVQISKTAEADLRSGDAAKIRGALDEVRLAGKAGARFVGPIVAILQKGTTRQLTEAAIDTLADLESPQASPAIAEYMQHRSVQVRRSAAKALAKTKGPTAVKALVKALSDQDPMVRGVAANALGAMKAKEAVPDLFLALDHRVNEAAPSIGMLCAPADCEKLSQRIGKIPFDVASAGVEQALFRTDVPDDTKIKLVGRIRELGTQEANKYLRETAKKWKGSARIKQALDQAVQATGGGS
jgi:HEAT repeat protein